MTFADYLNEHPFDASEETLAAMRAALCSRGKRKGRILASVPSAKGPEAVGAWRSLMSSMAPARAGLFSLMFAPEAEKAAFDAVEAWQKAHPYNRVAIEVLAQGDGEFNLFFWHHNTDLLRKILSKSKGE